MVAIVSSSVSVNLDVPKAASAVESNRGGKFADVLSSREPRHQAGAKSSAPGDSDDAPITEAEELKSPESAGGNGRDAVPAENGKVLPELLAVNFAIAVAPPALEESAPITEALEQAGVEGAQTVTLAQTAVISEDAGAVPLGSLVANDVAKSANFDPGANMGTGGTEDLSPAVKMGAVTIAPTAPTAPTAPANTPAMQGDAEVLPLASAPALSNRVLSDENLVEAAAAPPAFAAAKLGEKLAAVSAPANPEINAAIMAALGEGKPQKKTGDLSLELTEAARLRAKIDAGSDQSGFALADVRADNSVASTQSALFGKPSAPGNQDFAALIDRLVDARQRADTGTVKMTINHSDFGAINFRFETDARGLSVAMSSADPDFALTAQRAIAERLVSQDGKVHDAKESSGGFERQESTGKNASQYDQNGANLTGGQQQKREQSGMASWNDASQNGVRFSELTGQIPAEPRTFASPQRPNDGLYI